MSLIQWAHHLMLLQYAGIQPAVHIKIAAVSWWLRPLWAHLAEAMHPHNNPLWRVLVCIVHNGYSPIRLWIVQWVFHTIVVHCKLLAYFLHHVLEEHSACSVMCCYNRSGRLPGDAGPQVWRPSEPLSTHSNPVEHGSECGELYACFFCIAMQHWRMIANFSVLCHQHFQSCRYQCTYSNTAKCIPSCIRAMTVGDVLRW